MAGNGKEIDAKIIDTSLDFAYGLGGVGVDERATLTSKFGEFCDRHERPGFILGEHDSHEGSVSAHERPRFLDGAEGVARRCESGHYFGGKSRSDSHDQVVSRNRATVYHRLSASGIYAFNFTSNDFDTLALKAGKWAHDLFRPPIAGHDPKKGSREREARLTIHQDNTMTAIQKLAQPIGRDHAADTAAENQYGLFFHGCCPNVAPVRT